jgi:predicted transcriptional regulator
MAKEKINDRKMLRLIDKEKLSQSAAARKMGVTRQAVSKRLQELRGKTTRVVVAKKVEQCVDQKLDAVAQLLKINEHANELLDLCMAWGRGDDVALQVMESQGKNRRIRVGDNLIDINEFKFKDPRGLALKAMAEIRGQLKLQLEIFQALYDLRAAQEFQETVIKIIGEVSPDVRSELIHRLNKKRVIRSAVRFS